MKQIAKSALFLIATVAFTIGQDNKSSSPKFIPINVPGAATTVVNGVNNSGVMVGTALVPGEHGFAIVGSNVITIDVPRAIGTECIAINSAGAIVGTYKTSRLENRGFLYQNGKFTDIGPGTGFAKATGINDNGEIVGYYGAGDAQGFLWDGHVYTTIDVLGAYFTRAEGINNLGQVTLQWDDSTGEHSSIFDGTTYTGIDVSGAEYTEASAINNFGDVVATWGDANGVRHGAIYHAGQYHSFQMPGGTNTSAFGINDQDVVVGYSLTQPPAAYSGYKLIP
jgi:probable HAF family extracellular repeat protein